MRLAATTHRALAAVRKTAKDLCCPLGRFFANPHHLSGTVFAMLLTNTSTLVWAALVLWQRDVLVSAGSSYAFVTDYIDEDLLAIGFGSIALTQLVCLWAHREPTRFRNVGYALFALAWGFVFFHNITKSGPLFPTATSLSFAMAFAALYAWLDGGAISSKVGGHDDA